jgi:hypothetical protein
MGETKAPSALLLAGAPCLRSPHLELSWVPPVLSAQIAYRGALEFCSFFTEGYNCRRRFSGAFVECLVLLQSDWHEGCVGGCN